jgi:hypothetical protein
MGKIAKRGRSKMAILVNFAILTICPVLPVFTFESTEPLRTVTGKSCVDTIAFGGGLGQG